MCLQRIHRRSIQIGLNDWDNHDGIVTHLEPDILGHEVKWSLVSITMNKASGSDEIPVKIFKILKGDAMKVLHAICQQIWKIQQWTQNWKKTFFIPISKMGNAIKCSYYHTITFLSHTSKVMLKIVHAGRQQYLNQEPPDIQVGFQRGREIRDQIPNIHWIMQKTREY